MLKLILLLSLLPMLAHAHFDLSAGAAMRTYPSLGAQANLNAGYNFVFWGQGPRKSKGSPFFGLIRPALSVASSAVVNNYDMRLEVYPISFVTFVVGKKHIRSDYTKFTFYDCNVVRCVGNIDREYKQAKIALGFKKLIATASITESQNTYSDEKNEGKPVAEFRYAAKVNPREEKMYIAQYILGLKHSSRGIFGVLSEYVSFAKSDQTYNMDLFIYSTKPTNTNYIFGIGQFSSSHVARGLIGVFQMTTDFLPSSRIF